MIGTLSAPTKRGTTTTSNAMELVTFHCGDLVCGIDIRLVKEINSCLGVTRAPHARPYIMGAMCLRGEVVTVVDLARLLGIPPTAQPATKCVIVSVDGQWVALAVELVLDVASVDSNEIAPLPPNFQYGHEGAFSGVIQRKHGLILVLDVLRALHQDRPASERSFT